MNHKKRISRAYRAYGYGQCRVDDIIKLLELFHAETVYIEIIDIRADGAFCKRMLPQKGEYVLFSDASAKNTMDVIFSEKAGGNCAKLLSEIIDGEPEIVSLYLSELPLKDFINQKNKTPDTLIAKQAANCVIDIMLYECVLSVSFNTGLFHKSDYIPKLDEIVMRA